MNPIVQAAILGLIEGLTEFLPISSSGHLIVASSALRFNDPNKTFEVVIQLGAVLAVIWYYRLEIIKRAWTEGTDDIDYKGRFFDLQKIRAKPKPIGSQLSRDGNLNLRRSLPQNQPPNTNRHHRPN